MSDGIERLTTTAEVQAFADEARSEGRLALDTEFLWERTYAPIPCLVQVATADRLAVIDPLEGGDVGPIAQLVADPKVELLMHAPSGDLLLFARRFAVRPVRVFDVQLVAGFIGLGSSLAYDRLVERLLHVRLAHNETFTTWSKRPLSPTQVAYAADDVRHLHAIAGALALEIEARGRTAWAHDELDRRYGEGVAAPDPRRAYLKIPRRGRLTGRQLTVLREVAAWREGEAQTNDLPVGWVLKDPTVVEIARTMPRDAAAITRVRGAGGVSGSALKRLARAIAAGIETEPIEPPREPSQEVVRRVAAASELALVLLRIRCDEADLAPELVATRGELERFVEGIVTHDVDGHPLTQGWRHALVGAEVCELMEGRIAIAPLEAAPYLEIIRR
ncbi:MAG: HRDC domain-containing protein [Deltaproteobacteria bacterium]|nr:HRDC domain-containing protein [Deltaproteobacteria bacterium]